MAKNRAYEQADQIPLPVPEGTKNGDALVVGALPCVAETDRDADGLATVQTNGAYRLEVKGIGAAGNAAIPVGGTIFKDGNDLNADDVNGKFFGYLIDTDPIAAGGTRTVKVKVGR